MASWTIYSKNNVAKAVIGELELHDEWMAECYLTVSVKSAEPIDFAVGDYIDYRGERYTIQYDANVLKKASRGSYGEGFTYDNIKFVGLQDEVARCDFNDIVLNDNDLHYTALPTFPFYCETVDDLLDRIQANLEDLYPGQWIIIGLNTVRNYSRGTAVGRAAAFEEAYRRYIDPTGTPKTDPYGKQSVAESVDNITCWDATKKVHDDFGLNFIVRGRVMIVGTAGVFTANTFRYGKGNGLYEIERVADSDQQIVTRLRAYGSDENLPQHYYANLNTQVFGIVSNVQKFTTRGCSFTIDIDYNTKYFNYRSESYPGPSEAPNFIVEIKANDISVRGYVSRNYQGSRCYIYCEYTGDGSDDRDEPDEAKMAAFVNALTEQDKMYFVDYINKDTFDSSHKESSSQNLPDNMAVSRLMLSGFPNQSLHDWVESHKNDSEKQWLRDAIADGFTFSTDQYRPYIDSPNISEYGIRPSSIYFDGSNETDNIHPTIEGMEYGGVAIDGIASAEQVEDNGVYPAGEGPDNIDITLPNLGFDLGKLWDENATIDMKNGMCGARSFKIASKPKQDDNGRWVCNVARVHDESLDLWFPYNDFQIASGDKYVLTGIELPDAYVDAAAVKLLRQSIEALKKNHAPRYTYQPRIDEIFMQRQHDTAMSSQGVVSLHDTLKAGDIFSFADDDLNIDASVIIDVLTIKENGNNGIPTYEVTLRDEKQVGTIQKITNKVDSFFSESINGAGGAGFTEKQIASLINGIGEELFLSKQHDDVGKGNYTFEKDVTIKGKLNGVAAVLNEIISSEYTGDGMNDTGFLLQYANGRAKLVIDDLVARGKFTVNELESRIWTYAGGNMVFSGAGSTIFFVEYLDANDNSLGYTNINAPWMLAGKPLLASMMAWSKRRSVKRSLTDTEKAQIVKFRCYEYSDNGTLQTRNWWHLNDLAFCQTLNHVKDKSNSDGSYSGAASNSVYHRRVVSIGSKAIDALGDGRIYDYVDLSNVQGDYDPTYNDWPAAGDTIVQRGNYSDSTRRSMVTIEVTGDTRGLKVYDNIMGWYANTQQGEQPNGERYIFIGYNENTGRAKLDVHGDAYIGDPNGSTYIKYDMVDPTTGRPKLHIKAEVEFTNPDGDLDELIQKHQKGKTYTVWNEWVIDNVNTLKVGDLFIPTATTTVSGTEYKAGKAYKCITNGQSEFSELDYTDDTYAHNFDYLKAAMQGDTKILGGLVLSHTLVMRNTDSLTSVMAGLNGVLNTDLTDPLKSVAAWYGGDMVDLENLSDYWTAQQIADWNALTPQQKAASLAVAKSLDRHDGSGYRASGNISWDKEGKVTIKGNDVTAARYFLSDGTEVTAILNMFEIQTINGVEWVHVKNNRPFYSDSDISAGGAASGGGGGGGGASVLYELNDVKPDSEITPTKVYGAETGAVLTYGSDGKWYAAMPSSGVTTLAALTDVNVASPANGQVLTYNGSSQKWVAGNIPASASWGTVGTDNVELTIGSVTKTLLTSHQSLSGYATQEWVNDKGYLTSVSWNDINNKPSTYTPSAHNHDSRYYISSGTIYLGGSSITPITSHQDISGKLDKSGGTMTGTLGLRSNAYGGPSSTHGLNCNNSDIVNVNSIYTNDTSDDWAEGILFKRTNGNWDSIRALDGTWYFHANSGGSYAGIYANNVYATGDVTAASDERQKSDIEQVDLSVEQIANAPAIKFSWKDGRDNLRHVGSFAQYWQKVLPESVTDKNDILGLNYSSAALVSVVKVACRVVDHEERIKELEKENRELKEKLEQLRIA